MSIRKSHEGFYRLVKYGALVAYNMIKPVVKAIMAQKNSLEEGSLRLVYLVQCQMVINCTQYRIQYVS